MNIFTIRNNLKNTMMGKKLLLPSIMQVKMNLLW